MLILAEAVLPSMFGNEGIAVAAIG